MWLLQKLGCGSRRQKVVEEEICEKPIVDVDINDDNSSSDESQTITTTELIYGNDADIDAALVSKLRTQLTPIFMNKSTYIFNIFASNEDNYIHMNYNNIDYTVTVTSNTLASLIVDIAKEYSNMRACNEHVYKFTQPKKIFSKSPRNISMSYVVSNLESLVTNEYSKNALFQVIEKN